MPDEITGCKVFATTMERDRRVIGERVTEWIRGSGATLVDTYVVQSSDEAFHCLTIVIFYK